MHPEHQRIHFGGERGGMLAQFTETLGDVNFGALPSRNDTTKGFQAFTELMLAA